MPFVRTYTLSRRSNDVDSPVIITVIVCMVVVFGAAVILAWFVSFRSRIGERKLPRPGSHPSGSFVPSGHLHTLKRGVKRGERPDSHPAMASYPQSMLAANTFDALPRPVGAEVPTSRSDKSSSVEMTTTSEKHGESQVHETARDEAREPLASKRASVIRRRSFDEDTVASMYSSMSAPLEHHDALLQSPIEWGDASSAPAYTTPMTVPPPVLLRASLARRAFENSRTLMLATAHAAPNASSQGRGNPAVYGADNPIPLPQPHRVHWRLPITRGEAELHGRDGVSSNFDSSS